ncbi:glycyl-tRNA synthetase subunit beta [Intrasporangium oryzae NRRL B-24470]|uniref:Multifunctional fusion protein n=2 Tax=Intrasporangium TaxID=53357 RepID=W9GCP9_9MICO|nr:glycyl-tRNA synthetase subunit beta [Intrasporangium oryzae NRRL B-24470]
MQEAILRLQEFWASRGALVMQPFNTEVGAGTANPATSLRVLGPEPWQVAYVEPSVRPDDARYGENPNRLQTHTQYQVILKPAPENPQEVYLESLEALGIDTRAHDIRFIEDNWASPALGAWGLGWEVWLDGLEITQFTYFQQAGGIVLDPVAVEITYGLERIVMALENVRHFSQIQYNDDVTYGDVFAQAEYEMSRYYLDDADVELNHRLFQLYADEAQRMLDRKLPVPAYSYVLKCSHTFNVLDARGAISTTERARSFALMRRLTRAVSELWVARREELGFPLGEWTPPAPASAGPLPEVSGTQPLLIEIGVEELPHVDVRRATESVRAAVEEHLAATTLGHGAVSVKATPRRIVVTVEDVAESEADTTQTVRGPRASAAYGEDGEPSKALLGFLRGQGKTPEDVRRVDVDGVEYVAVERFVPGRTSPSIVAALADAAVRSLHAERNMRWGDPELSYSRPVRWLLVLLGTTHVPVAVSALVSGTSTRVLRTADQPVIEVSDARGFGELLARAGIVLDRDARLTRIVVAATELAASVGGIVDIAGESDLVDEITDIVEDPRAILGSFEERFLDLPPQVLRTVMRKHQRYLPVVGPDGRMLPHFITFANGPHDDDLVRAGNEAVIRARYEDASFFWRADLEVSPEEFRSRLGALTFEERLGSFDDRVNRIADLAETFSAAYDLDEKDAQTVRRAASLGKFDLASQMVVELSSLAGTMAQEYAARAGESSAVAQALAEMEMPRSSTSAEPISIPGAVLSLADRFDLLTSMYAVGSVPSGTSDPFGVRRTALGLVRVLRAFPMLSVVSVRDGIRAAAERLAEQGIETSAEAQEQAADFVLQRYELQLIEAGRPHAVVRAVLPAADRPARADELVDVLVDALQDEQARSIVAALQRSMRILPDGVDAAAGLELPETAEPAERELAGVVARIEAAMAGHQGDVARLFAVGGALPEAAERYFDEIRVMHDDPQVKASRLGLLARVAALGGHEVDWLAL